MQWKISLEISTVQYKGRTEYQPEKCTNLSFNLGTALISKSKCKTFVVAEALDKTT